MLQRFKLRQLFRKRQWSVLAGMALRLIAVSAICAAGLSDYGSPAAQIFGAVLIGVLGVVDPALMWFDASRLESHVWSLPITYSLILVDHWILTGWCIAVVSKTTADFQILGLRPISVGEFLNWCLLLVTLDFLVLAMLALLSSWGLISPPTTQTHVLTPRSSAQKVFAVLVLAPSAGFCEEILYRGFLLAELTRLTHSSVVAALISSCAFGFVHAGQGTARVIYLSITGVLLTFPVFATGSLYPSIALHFAFDAVYFGYLAPRIYRRRWRSA